MKTENEGQPMSRRDKLTEFTTDFQPEYGKLYFHKDILWETLRVRLSASIHIDESCFYCKNVEIENIQWLSEATIESILCDLENEIMKNLEPRIAFQNYMENQNE